MADTTEKTTELWEMYQNGLKYQQTMGLTKNIPMFVDFYEGRQWAKPTESTKNLPRPVINIIKMICRNKKSAILATPVRIQYQAEDNSVKVDRFNHFATYIQKELGQESIDKDAVKDAVIKGSYFYHYYWDSEGTGKDAITGGALRCELIDPLNIFFANPQERDEQKQKWILIATREEIESVKAKADKGVNLDQITADNADSKYNEEKEQDGNELVTVLTRYFRKNGEVYCEKGTQKVIINKAFPISPDIQRASEEYAKITEEDAPNNNLPDKSEDESLLDNAKATLYPIVAGSYEPRERSIYGIGEVEGLIPNQKSINFMYAMQLLNAQEIAWGKYIVHPQALKGQKISNTPGQVLVDYSNTNAGIRKMTEQAMQTTPMQLVANLMQDTRNVSGANEVMSGEVLKSSMSGAAIAQLQSQAQQPIEELKDAFWLVKEKQGKVLAQFFKLFYYEKEYSYEDTVNVTNQDGQQVTEKQNVGDTFTGKEYESVEFSVVVEATGGTKASVASDINMLDTLLSNGQITLKTYINTYPDDAISNKTKILEAITEQEKDQVIQLSAQVQELTAVKEQYEKIIEEQQKTVDQADSIINENMQLKKQLIELQAEYTAKIQQANQMIMASDSKLMETTADATEFAQIIANQGTQAKK